MRSRLRTTTLICRAVLLGVFMMVLMVGLLHPVFAEDEDERAPAPSAATLPEPTNPG